VGKRTGQTCPYPAEIRQNTGRALKHRENLQGREAQPTFPDFASLPILARANPHTKLSYEDARTA
jgi:hypothetical protein